MLVNGFIALLLSGVLAYLLGQAALWLAPRWRLLDRAGMEGPEGARKLHQGPRPVGGWALFSAFWLGSAPFVHWNRVLLSLFLGSLMVLFIGLLDDRRGLSPGSKLLGQLSAAALPILWGGLSLQSIAIFGAHLELGAGGILLTIFWIVSVTNALNLLDGLDGLAVGCALIAALFSALFAILSGNSAVLILTGGLLGGAGGFLGHNFYPARLFLGDEGSYFLGFLLGFLSLLALQPGFGPMRDIPVLAALLLLSLPLTDTAWAIIRRARAHRPIFAADRGHIHHRLLRRVGTQRKAVLLLYLLSLLLGLLALPLAWLR